MTRHSYLAARGRRRRWITVVVAVLSACAALLTVPLSATVAYAVKGDGSSPFATYNMHGSDNGSRWRSEIQPLAANNQVVMVQEAGAGPPLPRDDHRTNYRQIRLTPNRSPQPSSVTFVTWPAAGPNGSDRYVYYLQTDPRRVGNPGLDTWDGGQINLATVTDTPADEVRVLENAFYNPDPNAPNNRYRARPLLGLRFGNTWYWNIHARGEDVTGQPGMPGLLDQVRTFMATPGQGGRNWVLAGDFNVNILNRTDDQARTSLHLQAGETLLRTGQPTYIGGEPSELDYAVTHGLPAGFTATRPGGGGSDHVPVLFAQTPPPVQPPRPSHVFHSVLATPTGRLLQENPDRSIAVGDARYNGNQTWGMFTTGALTHYLQNIDTGDCIALAPSARRNAATSPIVAGKCDDPRAQWTISHLEDDPAWNEDNGGPQRWRNVADPGLCLTPSNTSVTATPCTEDPAQRWWDSPTATLANWQATTQNIRLESAFLGGRIRRAGNVPGTFTYTAPTPPRWWWIYWLFYEKQDFGWDIQKIDANDNLVRIKSVSGDNVCLGSQDVHATTQTNAYIYRCDDPRGVAGAGQRWLAEAYADGSVRYRNEANHLCLLSPDSNNGRVTLYKCEDIPAERWNVVNP